MYICLEIVTRAYCEFELAVQSWILWDPVNALVNFNSVFADIPARLKEELLVNVRVSLSVVLSRPTLLTHSIFRSPIASNMTPPGSWTARICRN